MSIPIKRNVDLKFIRKKNNTQINKDNISENINLYHYEYKVGDKVMLNNKDS